MHLEQSSKRRTGIHYTDWVVQYTWSLCWIPSREIQGYGPGSTGRKKTKDGATYPWKVRLYLVGQCLPNIRLSWPPSQFLPYVLLFLYYFSFNPHTFYLDLFEKKTLSTHNLPVKPKVKCADFFFLIIHWLKYTTIKIQKQSVLMYT